MKRNILTKFLLTAVLGLLAGLMVNAQTNLNGRYSYEVKNGEDASDFDFLLTFERQDAVYYSYAYKGYGTIGGKWTLENGLIKVTLTRGDANWTFKLKPQGDNLELTETLSKTGTDETPDFKTILLDGIVFKKEIGKPTGPDLTAQEASQKFLKLIKSVRTIKDFSPKNIERQTGVKVSFNEETRSEYGFGGNVIGAPDWAYGLIAYPYPSKDNKQTDTLRFSFDYQLHEPLRPDMTALCVTLDSYDKALKEVGYSQMSFFGPDGISGGIWFRRKNISINVVTDTYGKSFEDIKNGCVNMIVIGIDNDGKK